MVNDSLLRSQTDSGIGYVQSRSNNKAKKDKRKSKKRGSSRRNLNDSVASFNDASTGSNGMDASAPEIQMSQMSPNKNRSSVSPSYFDQTSTSNIAFEYGNKYVRPPSVEDEQNALLQTKDPNDPLTGHDNFQDEFEDEMDEIEMNAAERNFVNLGDMESQAGKRSKRRRCCATSICILLMLGAIVGTVVAIVLTQNKGGKEKTAQSVPEATNLLRLWCAEELDLGPGQAATFPLQAPKDCQVACNQADCCWNPKSDHFCTPETEQYCEGYKKPCAIMLNGEQYPATEVTTESPVPANDTVVVPSPPATLKTICVPEGPSFTATKVCHDLCARADCCWNSTSTVQCTADSWQANCAPYEQFCSFFNEHPPEGHGDDTTTSANNNAGGGTNNNEGKEDLPFPYASSELATFCAVENMRQNGPENCQQECNQAECCWKVGTVNCASTVPNDMCKDYTSECAMLNSLDTLFGKDDNSNNNDNNNAPAPFPAAPSGLNVYCDPSEMAEVSLHICQDKCEPAACCWSTNADSCASSVDPELCRPYIESCAILNDLASYPGQAVPTQENNNNGNVPTPPSDFNTRCAKENILGTSNGGDILIGCERDCLAASCCWQPNVDECINPRCEAYTTHCAVFVGLFQDTGGSGSSTPANSGSSTPANTGSSTPANTGSSSSGGSSGSSSVPAAPSDLASTCAISNLSTEVNSGAGIVECERKCLQASCCWKPDHAKECPNDSGCDAYMEPCGTNLVAALVALETGTSIAQAAGTQNSAAAQRIASACNDQNAIFVKASCEAACDPGDCCFDDAVPCASDVDCTIYNACGVLHRRNLRR